MEKQRYNKLEIDALCKEIKKRYSLSKYIESKGYQIVTQGSRKFIKCPFHKDNNPSLCISVKDDCELFHCFGCKKSGTIIDFYALLEGISIKEALRRLGRGIEFSFDLEKLLNEFYKDEEEEPQKIALKQNSMISVFCFKYLSSVRANFEEYILKKEFESVDQLYEKIDSYIKQQKWEKISSFYKEICENDFFLNRLKKLEERIKTIST